MLCKVLYNAYVFSSFVRDSKSLHNMQVHCLSQYLGSVTEGAKPCLVQIIDNHHFFLILRIHGFRNFKES